MTAQTFSLKDTNTYNGLQHAHHMQGGRSLSELSIELNSLYPGSERKVGKLFALDLYRGLARYEGSETNHRVGQIASAADTIETRIRQIESEDEPPSLTEVSLEARKGVGNPPQEPAYRGEDALLPYLREAVLRTNLIGNNFQEIGAGMITRLQSISTVKGDSSNGIYEREFRAIDAFLRALTGDRP